MFNEFMAADLISEAAFSAGEAAGAHYFLQGGRLPDSSGQFDPLVSLHLDRLLPTSLQVNHV